MSTILQRLLPAVHDTLYPISVMVVESDMVNAVTLPGGLIVVFTPLIKLADSPEEVAGVIAHELGHVEHRDPINQMVRQIGAATVMGMVTGGKTPSMIGDVVRDLIDARYSQTQESAADSFAVRVLAQSGIDPICFADFLTKIEADSSSASGADQVAGYFSTHPGTSDRIAKARAAAKAFDRATKKPIVLDWMAVKKNLPSVFN
jgi:predicted Zn-dependent protease